MIDAACNALAAELGLLSSKPAHDPMAPYGAAMSAPTSTGSQPSSSSTQQDQALLQAAQSLADYNVRLRTFLLRLCNPDDLGHAVSPEVRQLAAELATSKRFGLDHCDFHNPTTHDRSTK